MKTSFKVEFNKEVRTKWKWGLPSSSVKKAKLLIFATVPFYRKSYTKDTIKRRPIPLRENPGQAIKQKRLFWSSFVNSCACQRDCPIKNVERWSFQVVLSNIQADLQYWLEWTVFVVSFQTISEKSKFKNNYRAQYIWFVTKYCAWLLNCNVD